MHVTPDVYIYIIIYYVYMYLYVMCVCVCVCLHTHNLSNFKKKKEPSKTKGFLQGIQMWVSSRSMFVEITVCHQHSTDGCGDHHGGHVSPYSSMRFCH